MKVAICDDDITTLDNEYELIKEVLREKRIEHTIDVFSSPQELLQSETGYDIIFLDIEMNETNGINAAKEIKETNKNCLFFFVTNYELYFDTACNVRPFRFWTKPIDKHKLAYGIESAIKELDRNRQFIYVYVNSERIQIFTNNIIYIYVQKKKTHLVTIKGEITVNMSYQNIFEQIKEYTNFFETFRGYCINFTYVKKYDKDKIYCGYKAAKYEIYLSRRKQNDFQKRFAKWIGEK